jgi:hypothetical protein
MRANLRLPTLRITAIATAPASSDCGPGGNGQSITRKFGRKKAQKAQKISLFCPFFVTFCGHASSADDAGEFALADVNDQCL